MRTEGKGVPFDTDSITKAFLDLAKPLRGRETPRSQIVRELDDFNWCIHTVTPPVVLSQFYPKQAAPARGRSNSLAFSPKQQYHHKNTRHRITVRRTSHASY